MAEEGLLAGRRMSSEQAAGAQAKCTWAMPTPRCGLCAQASHRFLTWEWHSVHLHRVQQRQMTLAESTSPCSGGMARTGGLGGLQGSQDACVCSWWSWSQPRPDMLPWWSGRRAQVHVHVPAMATLRETRDAGAAPQGVSPALPRVRCSRAGWSVHTQRTCWLSCRTCRTFCPVA